MSTRADSDSCDSDSFIDREFAQLWAELQDAGAIPEELDNEVVKSVALTALTRGVRVGVHRAEDIISGTSAIASS